MVALLWLLPAAYLVISVTQLKDLFVDMDVELPEATVLAIGLSNLIVNWSPVLLPLLAVALHGYATLDRRLVRSRRGALRLNCFVVAAAIPVALLGFFIVCFHFLIDPPLTELSGIFADQTTGAQSNA